MIVSAQSVTRIEASRGWRERRVEVFELPEGKVLVKGQRARRSPWPHRVLNALARVLGVDYLKAVPVHGGARSQAIWAAERRGCAAISGQLPRIQRYQSSCAFCAQAASPHPRYRTRSALDAAIRDRCLPMR